MDEPAMLRLRLFGAMDASVGDAPWPRPQRHDTEVLWLFLLLHRDLPLRREHVAFSLWPDLTPEAARTRLRGHLHWLEHHLPPQARGQAWVERDRTTMRWCPASPTWLDLEAFEAELRRARLLLDDGDNDGASQALAGAIALYRGDLAPDFYAEWLEPHRQRLRAAYVDALQRSGALAATAGRLADAIATAGRVLAVDPLREETHRHLMSLYAQIGDRGAALRQLQTCTELLAEELGVEPDAETLSLGESIRLGAIGAGRAASAASELLAGPNDSGAARHSEQTDPSVFPAKLTDLPSDLPPELSDPSPASIGNLPASPGLLIGRERELNRLQATLMETRLLTLAGPGGVGKTRLALGLAESLRGRFTDGVWWVPLHDLRSPELVAEVLRGVIGVAARPGQDALEAVAEHIAARHALVVLDNCEHVIEGAAQVAAALLAAGPGPRLIATSREALAIAGESLWPVPPLDLPAAGESAGSTGFLESPAVQLFVHRVRGVWPGYDPAADRLPAIADICRRVDGLPLAIEIAASRVRVLSEPEIAERLRAGRQVLGTRRRSTTTHHRSLDDTIDWSYRLLTEPEQVLLRRLSVFAGGFTLAAAEAVGSAAGADGTGPPADAVLDLLARLIEKSLVVVEHPTAGSRRYRLLEVIRQFGLARLHEAGESAAVERRHAEYYQAFVARPDELGAERISAGRWFDVLEAEYANLRLVMRWIDDHDEIAAGLRFADKLNDFAYTRSHVRDDCEWLKGLLERVDDEISPALVDCASLDLARLTSRLEDHAGTGALIRASIARAAARADRPIQQCGLVLLAYAEMLVGHIDQAWEAGKDALYWAKELEDPYAIGKAETVLADVALRRGDLDEAEAHFSAARLILPTESGSRTVEFNLCLGLGRIAQGRGDYAAARAHFVRGLRLSEREGSHVNEASWHSMIGLVCIDEGDYAAAIDHLKRAMSLYPRPMEPINQGRCLNNLGMAHFRQGDYAVARLFFEKAMALKRPYGDRASWSLCYTLVDLADLHIARGDLGAARPLAEEGLAAARTCGSVDLQAWSARVLAKLSVAEGDPVAALPWLRASLEGEQAAGSRPGLARTLDVAATVALAQASPDRALRLAGAADGLREASHTPRAHDEGLAYQVCLEAGSAALGGRGAEDALAEGRALPVGAAIALALVQLET
jgi:predicted ATPase/DNA-binding SARP family transcriptional activator/Flp pilus assembly protein TadD